MKSTVKSKSDIHNNTKNTVKKSEKLPIIVTKSSSGCLENKEKNKSKQEYTLSLDSEFFQALMDLMKGEIPFLDILGISGYCPEIDEGFYWDKYDFGDNFNPFISFLKKIGHQVKTGTFSRPSIIRETILKAIKRVSTSTDNIKNIKQKLLGDKVLLFEFREKLKIDLNKLHFKIKRDSNSDYRVSLKQSTIEFKVPLFFEYADFFKQFGNDWQWLYKDAGLTQFRTIKIKSKINNGVNGFKFTILLDEVPTDIVVSYFDCRYVFPPRKASLDGQTKTFGIETSKLSLSEAIKEQFGKEYDELFLKEHMDYVREKYFEIYKLYAIQDAKITYLLYKRLVEMKVEVAKMLDLPVDGELGKALAKELEVKETCGSNIKDYLFALIKKHFIGDFSDNDTIKLLLTKMLECGASHLSKVKPNEFGFIPCSTVGGLLFTRCAEIAKISGILLDLDEASCYATALTNMNVYYGQPVFASFTDTPPTLKEAYELLNNKVGVPKDGWLMRVSGKLDKAYNTLILSDLGYEKGCTIRNKKSWYFPDGENVDEYKDTINLYDSDKPTEPTAWSQVYSKEIIHGVVTEATVTALQDLPEEWMEEFWNLEVEVMMFFPNNLICDSLEEYQEKVNELPEIIKRERLQWVLNEDGVSHTFKVDSWQTCKANVALRFPMHEYYTSIKKKRSQLKKDKNPLQEILKLILNSTYGIMASFVMKSNNVIGANWITSCARAAAWRMVNSLNGFAPITDGSSFNWLTVPVGLKFKNLIRSNPKYLTTYDATIKNPLPLNQVFKEFTYNQKKQKYEANESGFSNWYIQHLESFISKSDWLTQMYSYDFKKEVEKIIFDNYYNSGAGNYCKEWSAYNNEKFSLQVEGGSKLKCRSYQESSHLTKWFKDNVGSEYKEHYLYVEKEILKLSQGSQDAIHIIRNVQKVGLDNKFAIGFEPELAERILDGGIAHPMGMSKHKIKLMKLISPSQFTCYTSEQKKEVARIYEQCNQASKLLLKGKWLDSLDFDYLDTFIARDNQGHEWLPVYVEDWDKHYYQMNLKNPVGIGFELLCWGNENWNQIEDVRKAIWRHLQEDTRDKRGIFRLDTLLNFQHHLDNASKSKYLKHLLAATIIIKTNFKFEYHELLANTAESEPMQRKVFSDDVQYLKAEKTTY